MSLREPLDVALFDTTLRDGTQRKGISLSVNDKLKIAGLLDEFGVSYIEGGWPGSNPKDCEFFRKAKDIKFCHARLVAFGSTRRKNSSVQDDTNLKALLEAETPAVALVGKSWTLHVEKVLETSEKENLSMIRESVLWMKEHGREVIYDAEHFFDGYRANPQYAISTLFAAAESGADWLVLCDTNGGSLPGFVSKVVTSLREEFKSRKMSVRLGIHTHNDAELAVANALAAVEAGCVQVQGTVNGYGERCGNANLISLVPTLELKMGKRCLQAASLPRLTSLSRKVSELVNLSPDSQAAYVGQSAFAHKGGIHVAAVEKLAESYEHLNPSLVGNTREIVVSELAGRGNVRVRAQELGLSAKGLEGKVLDRVKELESKGFQFENAEASFELLIHRSGVDYQAPFELLDMMVVCERASAARKSVQATIKLKVGSEVVHTVAEGDGPVHALDAALRKALTSKFPEVLELRLVDYKVRILDPEKATAAVTRVLIEAGDAERHWSTVGCSDNIIEASASALLDSFEYCLLKSQLEQKKVANAA